MPAVFCVLPARYESETCMRLLESEVVRSETSPVDHPSFYSTP